MKIVTIIGARPQFIKAATVSRVVGKKDDLEEIIIHTGQHFDKSMSEVFFEEMQIPKPDYNLNISSLSHGAMTGRMMEGIEEILMKEKPDWVLVYGDTNSTLAGALAAAKLHFNLAHIEAGLRSFNMKMPEEINRILTDNISNILFCPNETSINNLREEGFSPKKNQLMLNVGDVMLDATLFYQSFEKKPEWFKTGKEFVLATIHRAENTDDPIRLMNIIEALNEINSNVPVILPIHPRTREVIERSSLKLDFATYQPVGYFEMIYLLKRCSYVLSDSGGVQKESYFHQKQCLILRDETEWTELVDSGFNILVGADKDMIIDHSKKLNDVNLIFRGDLYGTGDTSSRIVEALQQYSER